MCLNIISKVILSGINYFRVHYIYEQAVPFRMKERGGYYNRLLYIC